MPVKRRRSIKSTFFLVILKELFIFAFKLLKRYNYEETTTTFCVDFATFGSQC